jgi:hypothetical protein
MYNVITVAIAHIMLFNPREYIQSLDNGFVLCMNPVADGGLSAITVNTTLRGDRKRAFQDAVRRMVLNKLFSPKFAEVILLATEQECTHIQMA